MRTLSLRDHLRFFLLFLAIAMVYTFPLVLNMGGAAGGDGYVFIHAFWWFKKALLSLRNPFFTDYLFYPDGVSLVFQSSTFSNFLLTLPVSLAAGANAAVNAAYLLGYAISGYAAFLLAFELTGSKPSAFIAGLIYAFSPFHFIHGAGHLNISTIQWLPLYLLMFKRAMEREGKKWALFAGLVMGWIIITDQFQTILAALLTLLLLPFVLFRSGAGAGSRRRPALRSEAGRRMGGILVIAAVAGVVSCGYLYQVVEVLANSPDTLKIGPFDRGGANTFSGDILGYFVPPPYHPMWGRIVAPFSPGGESTLFFGYIPLLLAALGGVKYFRNGVVRLISALCLVFWVLSLGTTLHVNHVWEWGGTVCKLPFLLLTHLPLLGEIRTPCRFHIVTILGVSLLAAFGAKWLLERNPANGGSGKTWLACLLAGMILVEFLPGPAPQGDARVPEVYRRMAGDDGPYTVLELPLSRWSSFNKNGSGSPAALMYYQTVHGKRIFNGLLTRVSDSALAFRDQILDAFTRVTEFENYGIIGREKRSPTDGELSEARSLGSALSPGREQFFRRYDIRYIVLHAPLASHGSLSRTFVESFTGRGMVDAPDGGLAYLKVR